MLPALLIALFNLIATSDFSKQQAPVLQFHEGGLHGVSGP